MLNNLYYNLENHGVLRVRFNISMDKSTKKSETRRLRYRFINGDKRLVYIHKKDIVKLIGGKYDFGHDELIFIDAYEYGNNSRVNICKTSYIRKAAVEKQCKLILLEEADNPRANTILHWLNNLE